MSERITQYEQTPRFNSEIDDILSKKVTATNINTFADDALIELIDTVNRVVGYYDNNPTLNAVSQKETEVSAFSYSGLDPVFIESALDRISEVVEKVQQLEVLINKRTDSIDQVIVPPDIKDVDLEAGNGDSNKGFALDKLKLLLLLLQEQCGVVISDPKQLIITKGINPPSMFRKLSYQLINIPSLHRDVLICNEYGNTTFIFDSSKYEDEGISGQNLIFMSKEELKKLQEIDGVGTILNYSDTFAERLVSALENPLSYNASEPKQTRSVDILRPQQAPEGHLTISGLATKLDASHKTIAAIIEKISEELGEVARYPSRGGATRFFSIEQQLLIEKALPQKAPEGYVTWKVLATTFDMNRITLLKVVERANINLGEIKEYRSNVGISEYLSPDQQRVIAEVVPPKPPENWVSLKELALIAKASPELLRNIISQNENIIGEVKYFRAPGPDGLGKYYSPQQQELIVMLVEQSPLPPEGFKTAEAIARDNNTNGATIIKIAKKYQQELGEVKEYRSNTGLSIYYSNKQQSIIESYLLEVAPEGHRTLEALARIKNLSVAVLQRTVATYSNEIGSGVTYRAGGSKGSADWYSPAQQEAIERLAPSSAPKGYLTSGGICQKYELKQGDVERAIHELNNTLGDTVSYISKSNTGQSFYYSPEQQLTIMQHVQTIIS